MDFDTVVQYKNRYRKGESWSEAIEAYEKVESYASKEVSKYCNPCLELIAKKLELLDDFQSCYSKCVEECTRLKQKNTEMKVLYSKKIENLTINDVYEKHHLLSSERKIFVVLGNHEYIGFNSINDAVIYYKDSLNKLGIKLLHNNYEKISANGKSCVIFGGDRICKI